MVQSNFCDQTLYIINVCKVISRVPKVALLNNFQNESKINAFCLRTLWKCILTLL